MKTLYQVITVAVTAALLCMMVATVGTAAEPVTGTRSGEIGWQYDTFAQNLQVNVTPTDITTSDRIIITINSKIPDVWIRQASAYGVVYPKDGVQFPFTYPFLKKTDTKFECTIEPFPLNGYRIEFYIIAYDYFFALLDSRSSMSFSYDVQGSGWKQDSFDDNIELTYWPLRANATEEVIITLRSKHNVSISGANLYITYVTAEGDSREGGYNFTKTNVNSTEMKQRIPGYRAGTNVTFWVTTWDQYNAPITSRMYNYSIMGIAEYTDFPFEYTDGTGDKSLWTPDGAVLLPMAGMCALAIPLFIYLYAINARRRKRAVDLVKTRQDDRPMDEDEGVKSDE